VTAADPSDELPVELSVELLIEHPSWRELEQVEALVSRAAQAAAKAAAGLEEKSLGEKSLKEKSGAGGPFQVNINLSNDNAVQALNRQFRGRDRPTNVLSFPFETDFPEHIQAPAPLGDIIIAYETVMLEARQQHKRPEHHLAHLVVHGVLHLFGHDHQNDREAAQMEALEIEILNGLSIPSPYAEAANDDSL